MRHFFSNEGKAALRALINANALIAFDFDGTLSPMVMLPHQAKMPAGVAHGFRKLCETMPVAVITGRSVEDIAPRLATRPKYLIGCHGAEGIPGRGANFQSYRKICEHWMHQIRDVLQWEHVAPGVMIEHKTCSICVHYRLARDREAAARRIESTLPQLDPLPLVIGGKLGINLLPPEAPNKRQALERLLEIEGAQIAFYIGDDETDEIVFRNAPPEWLTVRVGYDSNSAARFFLPHQSEITECLQVMTRLMDEIRPHRNTNVR